MSEKSTELNNEVMQKDDNGFYKLYKDKEAIHAYYLFDIKPKKLIFLDPIKRIAWMVEHHYYYNVFKQYGEENVERIVRIAESYHFEFQSYMAIEKFYQQYALKSDDKKVILENYTEHNVIVALYYAHGDMNKAEEYIRALMEQRYQPSTPSYLNAGRARRGELVSCFLMQIDDSLNSINYVESTAQQLSKIGGGVAIDLSRLRSRGEDIKGIQGIAKGVIPVARKLQLGFAYADQLGQRPGAGAAYLNIFHWDMPEFLDTKKENADEDVRLSTLSIGLIVPDKFFDLAKKNQPMYLFAPHSVYKTFGIYLSDMEMNEWYDRLVSNSQVKKRKVNAREVLNKIAQMQMQSGYPYMFYVDNANRQHPLKKLGSVKMSNLCVTGDTKLLTDHGYKPVYSLYKKHSPIRVIVDKRTITNNKEGYGTQTFDAVPVELTKHNANVYRVKTKQGFEIKSTIWHKYYVLRNEKIIKVMGKDLKIGDKLLIQSGNGAFGSFHDTELAYLAGIITGDGTIVNCHNRQGIKIYLYDNKKQYKNKIEGYVSRVIKRYLHGKIKYNANLTPTFKSDNKCSLLYLESKLLGRIFKEFGFVKATKTEVPEFVLNGDSETQSAYLSGLYQMDGSVNMNINSKALSVELTQVNKHLLQDIQIMLINNNIYSTIYCNKRDKSLLPDGRGGMKLYPVKDTYKLSVQDRYSRELLNDWIELKYFDKEKFRLMDQVLQKKSRRPKHHYLASICSIEHAGTEDVYDTTQPDHHSLIFNGIVTGNCTEINQLQEVSTITNYGHPDQIRYDVSCNLGSLNIVNVMEHHAIAQSVRTGIDMLTEVSDQSNIENAPGVLKANQELHSIGLGAMNLNGYLAKNHISYESEEAKDFVNTFFMMVNYYSIQESMYIARRRNKTFKGFKKSSYADGSYFEKYVKNSFVPKTNKVIELFKGIKIPDKNDWKALRNGVMKYGLYNAYRLALAPTQSISYVQNSTQSVMPVVDLIEKRKYNNSYVMYPMPFLSPQTMWYYKSAYHIDQFKLIDLIATIQQHIDQGISTTLFVDSQTSTRQLARLYIYAYHRGLKSLYYTRTQLLRPEECESCSV